MFGQGGFKRQFKLPTALNNTTKNVFETPAGNYIVCGIMVETVDNIQTNRLAIMGLNSQGQLQWTKKYGNSKFEYLDNSLIAKWFYKNDNFIYHAGCVRDSNNAQIGVLIKFNLNGDTIWQKRFYDPNDYTIPQMLIKSCDNGFFITGIFEDPVSVNRTVMLIKIDSNGNELWRKKITKVTPNAHDGKVILQDSATKKIVIVGYQYIGSSTAYTGYTSVLILDSLGVKLGQHNYGGQGLITNIIQTKDKKFIAVGSVRQSLVIGNLDTYKSYAVKFDINSPNVPIWSFQFDKTAVTNLFTSLTELGNEDVLITGIIDTMQQNNLATNCLQRITRVNKNGAVLSTKYYDYSPNTLLDNNQTILSLNPTSDGGFISAIQVFNTSPNPFFIVKYDSTGCDSNAYYCSSVVLKDNSFLGKSVKVYPNPTNGAINIEIENANRIQIINILGELVKHEELKVEKQSIDLSNLQNGVYFLKVFDKNKLISTIKIIKE